MVERLRVGTFVGLVVAAMLLALTGAPASAEPTFTVHPVPGTQVLNDVACATATTCVAVGQFDDATGSHGVLVPIVNGVPGAPQVVVGTLTLSGVACSDATTCVAVGRSVSPSGDVGVAVVPIVNGVAGAPQLVAGATGSLNDVACYSATSCVAVGSQSQQGLVVPITNGTPGAVQLVPTVSRGLTGVDCYSPTSCTAVGLHVVGLTNDGVLVPIENGVAGASQRIAGTRNLNRIACGDLICEATGTADTPRQPAILQVINGVPGSLQMVPQLSPVGISNLFGIACPTDAFCAAVGNADTGVYVPVDSGVPGTPLLVPGTTQLFGIACTTATTCIAVGNADNVGVVVTISEDAVAPVLQLPGPITVDAAGPEGAPVTYTVTATDAVDPNPTVTCTPPPGSTFPIGTTTVTCTATDAAGNTATDSFTVTVTGADDQLAALVDASENLGPGNSVLSKAQKAQERYAAGDVDGACKSLNDYIRQVRLHSPRHIPAETADARIADAERIRQVLGC